MRAWIAFFILFCTLAARAASVRDLYLPPWYDKANRQIFQLELRDVKANRIELDHPCTISVTNRTLEVTDGVAKVTLFIDLKSTPTTFPLVIMALDARGQTTEYEKLMCHLSLVAQPIQVCVQGDTFALTNLTEEPFELEQAVGLAIASQDDRHVRGTLKGSGRLKLKGRAEIPLVPNRRAEVLARHAARELK
jgi:hypothetical protein